jgi:hypothetical protein
MKTTTTTTATLATVPASAPVTIADYGSPDERFPLNAIKGDPRLLVESLSLQTGGSPQLPACAILAAAGAALGKGLQLESTRGLFVYANPYFILSVPSGVGKSVIARRTIELAQDRLDQLSKSIVESRDGDNEEPYPATFATDTTNAALICALHGNPWRCVAVVSAEARGAVSNILGRYAKGRLEADALLQGFSGDYLSVHRKDGGVQTIKSPCVTAFLAVQNDKADLLYGSEEASDAGLLARFLPAVAESENRGMDHDCIDPLVMAEWHGVLDDAIALYRNAGESPLILVEQSVAEARTAFEEQTEQWIQAEPSEAMRNILRRQSEVAHKLALILHFFRHRLKSPGHRLCVEDWDGAARIVRWHLPQAAMLLSASARKALESDRARLAAAFDKQKTKAVPEATLRRHHNIQKDLVARVLAAFPEEFRRYEVQKEVGRPSIVIQHLAA